MATGFPPQPSFPIAIDSDKTLFLVYNTSEAKTTRESSAWEEELEIQPVNACEPEIWADNGFANISGEIFYYDSVEKTSVVGSGAVLGNVEVDQKGSLVSISVINGGQDYCDPHVSVRGSGRGAKVKAIVSNGAVTKIEIDQPGFGYNSNTTLFEFEGKVFKLKRCCRSIGGKPTRFNPSGTWVRGFVMAEHHNQLVDAAIATEKYILDLDEKITKLEEQPICIDDAYCVDALLETSFSTPSECEGVEMQYVITVTGAFNSFTLDFGDGQSTTSAQSGSHIYPPGAKIDPVITVVSDNCTVIQTPVNRNEGETPQTPGRPTVDIPVPQVPNFPSITIPDFEQPDPQVELPQIVFPCLDVTPISLALPSITIVPPVISFIPPSFGPISLTVPSISFGPLPTVFPGSFIFGPAPLVSFTPGSFTFGPSPIVSFTPGSFSFGPAPIVSFTPGSFTFGPAPIVSFTPGSFSFGPAPTVNPGTYTFGPVPKIPTGSFTFGPAPKMSSGSFTFGPAPKMSPGSFTFGPAPKLPTGSLSFGPAPSVAPGSFTFGPAPKTPSGSFTFGPAPKLPTGSFAFGPAPTVKNASFIWGTPPKLEVYSFNWGTPPKIENSSFTWGTPPKMQNSSFIWGTPPKMQNSSFIWGTPPKLETYSFNWGTPPKIENSSFVWGTPPKIENSSFIWGTPPKMQNSSFIWGTPPKLEVYSFNWGTPPKIENSSFVWGDPPKIEGATFTWGTPPKIEGTSFSWGPAPKIEASSMIWGDPPKVSIEWGTPPTISCVVTVECGGGSGSGSGGSSGFRRGMSLDENFVDDFNTQDFDIEINDLGIPSEIRVVAPKIPDIQVKHDIPDFIEIKSDLPSRIMLYQADPLPKEIKIINEAVLPESIRIDAKEVPNSIKIDSSSLPGSISLVAVNLPSVIRIDGSEIPETIRVTGIPESIEVKMPSEIVAKLEIPENLEIPLVYKGGPVPIQFDASNLLGGDDQACFALVPCKK